MARSLSEICSRSCCTTGSWLGAATDLPFARGTESGLGLHGQCAAIAVSVRWYPHLCGADGVLALRLLAGQEVLRLDVLEELPELLDHRLLGGLRLALELDRRLG